MLAAESIAPIAILLRIQPPTADLSASAHYVYNAAKF